MLWHVFTRQLMMVAEFLFTVYSFFFSLGWPKLQWFVTANLNRHPKDWQPPSNLDRSSPAYIEVCGTLLYLNIIHKLMAGKFSPVVACFVEVVLACGVV